MLVALQRRRLQFRQRRPRREVAVPIFKHISRPGRDRHPTLDEAAHAHPAPGPLVRHPIPGIVLMPGRVLGFIGMIPAAVALALVEMGAPAALRDHDMPAAELRLESYLLRLACEAAPVGFAQRPQAIPVPPAGEKEN